MNVAEKAARQLREATSRALVPVRERTTVEMRLGARRSSGSSQRGGRESARPVLKVVSSYAMSGRGRSVGMPCTRICTVGNSKRTVVVPGMRCRKEETLLLSEASFTVSMVMSVRLLSGRQTTRWIRVAWRAVLMLSLMATVEEVRGVPSRLIRRRRSLWVSVFA